MLTVTEEVLAILDPVNEPMPSDLPPDVLRVVVGKLRLLLAMRLPESDIDGLAPDFARAIREAYSHEPTDGRLASN